jgi:hypothetical protein
MIFQWTGGSHSEPSDTFSGSHTLVERYIRLFSKFSPIRRPEDMAKIEAATDANLICSVAKALDTSGCLASADRPLFAHEAAKRRHFSIATRKPHDCTAMGRAISAFLLDKEYITILDQTKLECRTEIIIANRADQRSQRSDGRAVRDPYGSGSLWYFGHSEL